VQHRVWIHHKPSPLENTNGSGTFIHTPSLSEHKDVESNDEYSKIIGDLIDEFKRRVVNTESSLPLVKYSIFSACGYRCVNTS